MKTKSKIYNQYFERISIAINNKFFLEAVWIEFSLIEDRLVSILISSGGSLTKKGKPIQMVGNKMKVIKARMKTNKLLEGHLVCDDLPKRISAWCSKRNKIMHALVDQELTVDNVDSKIEELAISGKLLAKNIAAAAMRIKKHVANKK